MGDKGRRCDEALSGIRIESVGWHAGVCRLGWRQSEEDRGRRRVGLGRLGNESKKHAGR